MRPVRAGLAYFGLVFGAGFVLGSIRVPWLVPRLGERLAELLEMPVMFGVVVLAARWVVARFALPPAAGPRLTTGLLALALMVGAELSLSLALQDRSLGDYLASRDPVSGAVYLIVLGLYGLMPWLLARIGQR